MDAADWPASNKDATPHSGYWREIFRELSLLNVLLEEWWYQLARDSWHGDPYPRDIYPNLRPWGRIRDPLSLGVSEEVFRRRPIRDHRATEQVVRQASAMKIFQLECQLEQLEEEFSACWDACLMYKDKPICAGLMDLLGNRDPLGYDLQCRHAQRAEQIGSRGKQNRGNFNVPLERAAEREWLKQYKDQVRQLHLKLFDLRVGSEYRMHDHNNKSVGYDTLDTIWRHTFPSTAAGDPVERSWKVHHSRKWLIEATESGVKYYKSETSPRQTMQDFWKDKLAWSLPEQEQSACGGLYNWARGKIAKGCEPWVAPEGWPVHFPPSDLIMPPLYPRFEFISLRQPRSVAPFPYHWFDSSLPTPEGQMDRESAAEMLDPPKPKPTPTPSEPTTKIPKSNTHFGEIDSPESDYYYYPTELPPWPSPPEPDWGAAWRSGASFGHFDGWPIPQFGEPPQNVVPAQIMPQPKTMSPSRHLPMPTPQPRPAPTPPLPRDDMVGETLVAAAKRALVRAQVEIQDIQQQWRRGQICATGAQERSAKLKKSLEEWKNSLENSRFDEGGLAAKAQDLIGTIDERLSAIDEILDELEEYVDFQVRISDLDSNACSSAKTAAGEGYKTIQTYWQDFVDIKQKLEASEFNFDSGQSRVDVARNELLDLLVAFRNLDDALEELALDDDDTAAIALREKLSEKLEEQAALMEERFENLDEFWRNLYGW